MSARPKLRLVPTGKWVATNQKYLQWLDTFGSWRFRRVVPKNLRESIGKTEWTETLKARTENEAIRLLQPHIRETDRIIALAEQGNWPPIPDEDVDLVFYAWRTAEPNLNTISSTDIPYSVERFLTGPRELRFAIDYQVGEHTLHWAMPCGTRTRITAFFDNPDRVAAFRRNPDAVARLLNQCRRHVAVQALQKGLVEPFNVARPADIYASPGLKAPALAAVPATIPVVYPPLSLGGNEAPDRSDLVSKWAKESNPEPRWLYQTRLSMKRFAALVELDHDDATRVTKAEVIRFKEKLDEKGLKSPTINRYLSEIKGPFEWAFKNEKIDCNPTEGVTFARKERGQSGRKGYTDEQARLILLAARDEELPHRRWIPWVCAFAGTRLDEVAGRDVRDIRKIGAYWAIDIPDAKNPGSVRMVPLHRVLIDEGFIEDYVEKLPQDGPLFPDLTPDRFGRRAGTATKRIGRWLRGLQKETGVLLVDETRYAPNHSWRHRFKSEARRVRIEEEVHDALTGHREGKVSRDYGEYYVTEVLGPAIDSMISPFDLPNQEPLDRAIS
jgi:integrase